MKRIVFYLCLFLFFCFSSCSGQDKSATTNEKDSQYTLIYNTRIPAPLRKKILNCFVLFQKSRGKVITTITPGILILRNGFARINKP